MAAPQIVSVKPASFWPETVIRIAFDQVITLSGTPFSLTRGENGEHTVAPREAVLSSSGLEVDLYCYGIPNGTYTLATTDAITASGNPDPLPAGTEVVFVANGQPAGRSVTLREMIPQHHWNQDDSGDLERFVDNVLQPIVDELLSYTDRWTDIIDPDLAPENTLDLMLQDLGNPFPFTLDIPHKRALVQSLVSLYQQMGTANGIEAAIRFFVGLESQVIPLYQSGWRIGTHRLNRNTFLTSQSVLYTFDIMVFRPLNEFEDAAITWLAEYIKASHEHFRRIFVEGDMATITTVTQVQKDINTDGEKALNSNLSRKWLLIQNNGDEEIYVGFDTAATITNMIVGPGKEREWDTAVVTSAIWLKAAAGVQDVRLVEGV